MSRWTPGARPEPRVRRPPMPDTPGSTRTSLTPLLASLTRTAMRIGSPQALAAWTARDFGPLVPLQPRTAPDSAEQQGGPRQFQYPVGANIIPRPRAEYSNLTPFDQLRLLSRMYDVSAICINTRIEEICAIPWRIVPRDKGRKADL